MPTTDIPRPPGDPVLGYGMSTAPSEATKQTLLFVHQSRERAVRLALSAALARRDLNVNVFTHWTEKFSPDVSTFDSVFDVRRPVTAIASNWTHFQEIKDALKPYRVIQQEADDGRVDLQILLDAAVKELLVTNNALTEMAATAARQLVGHPGKLVSGTELAVMLYVSEEAVRQRHQAGKLIAILREGRERGRGFPVFQSWAGVAGAPLEQILGALGYRGPTVQPAPLDAADAFQFFTSRNEFLGGFTPVEVLTGAGLHDSADQEASDFLDRPYEERLDLVTSVARAEAELRRE